MMPLSRAAFYTSLLTAFNPVLMLVSGHGGGAQPSKCSTYTNTINLPFDVKLEYVSSETTLSVRMSSPRQSYLGFGISDINGRMKNSEAVIGTIADTGGADIFGTSSVELYALSDAAVQLVTDPSRKTLMDTSFKQDDLGSVLEFKKLLSDGTGNKDILGNGLNKFIWSSGFSNNLSFGHADAYGSVEISLSPCVEDGTHGNNTTIGKRNDKNLFLIHGILAIISFAFLIPLSIIAAFLRKCKQLHFLNTYTIFDKKIWFVIHTMANVVSYIFVVIMFGLSLRAVKEKGGIHFHNTHMVLGLITILLLTVQVIFALVRPPSPGAVAAAAAAASDVAKDGIENGQISDDDDNNNNNGTENSNGTENDTNDKKSCFPSLRKIWGRSHRLFAVLIFIFGLWQIHTGISLYQNIYAIEKNYIPLYWIVLSSLFFVSVGLVVYLKKFYS